MAAKDTDPTDLHGLAVDAQTDIQKLATGLAHAGAAPQAVATLTKMGDVLSQVIRVLGQGPQIEGQGGPPGAPEGPPPPGGPPGAPQAPAPGPPPAPASPPQNALQGATQHLHAAMQASAAARRQPPA